jgi:8-oxo-dGTP diphosphatase
MKVKFFDLNADKPLKYAVICARYNGKWVFCKHKIRDTYEIPGGHREDSEDIETTAKRELWEETGAKNFDICPVCIYSFTDYGMLYFAEIRSFGELPPLEIEKIKLFDDMPENLTYPAIQPYLFERVQEFLEMK